MERSVDLVIKLKSLKEEDKGITIIKSENEIKYISYKSVYENSFKIYNQLKLKGLEKGNEVIVRCENPENFIYAFWGCLLGGYIAIPISTNKNECKQNAFEKIVSVLEKPYLITDVLDNNISESFDDRVLDMNYINFNYIENLYIDEESIITEGNEVAYVQFSSGSTGDPKGVVVRRGNLATNINDVIDRLNMTNEDKCLSWQPLTHCYGLTIFHILPIILGVDQYLIETDSFMREPLLWMQMVDKYRITRLGTIPFAVRHFTSVYEKAHAKINWDLSCVKSITIGGEHVNFDLCNAFLSLMEKSKLDKNVIKPIYGLSEATTGVSILNMDDKLDVLNVSRCEIEIGKKISFLEVHESNDMRYIKLGKPLDSNIVEIVNEDREVLSEGTIGHVFVKGGNITDGYFRDAVNTEKTFTKDGCLNTGDIGFMKDDSLYIVAREKEIIVVNGIKYNCIDVEGIINTRLSSEITGQVVVCSIIDNTRKSEKAIGFMEYIDEIDDITSINKIKNIKNTINKIVFDTVGLTMDLLIPIKEIPKTNSGKIKRNILMNRYENREFENIIDVLSKSNDDVVNYDNLSMEKVKTKIIRTMEELFKIDVDDLDASFQEYGIVSVNIPFLIKELNKEFNIVLNVDVFFNYPSINELSKYISEFKTSENNISSVNIKEKKEYEEKIAIVGMSCRFPGGANSIDEYWDLLIEGRDGITDVPESRWSLEKYYDEDENIPGKMYCKKGGFLNIPIDEFDARFFNISPKEAVALDPQQRLMLELTWEAFENANLDVTKYKGSNTSVYLGMATIEYTMAHLYSGDLTNIDAYSLTGGCMSTACGRISYTFGFEGPCMTVDTACSSSLTALHIACNAMRTGETDLIVLGGVNLMASPSNNVGFSKLKATSTDGRSKSFDASADGYGRSEGAGVIILKKLSDAIKDNDNILGIIKGTGINQDGKSNGLTAPNGEAQKKLIKNTLNKSNLLPTDIDYIEMHGTGTKLGDPIEVSAVSEVYCKTRSKLEPLKIGSVKSNIGHLEAASGIASIIKVLLSFKNNTIPANLHFNNPNPFINWNDSNIKVIDKNTNWVKSGRVRRAAVNGFGFGGSNSHVIIEEFKEKVNIEKEMQLDKGLSYTLKISGKSEKSLKELVNRYITLLDSADENRFIDIVYSANIGRTDLDYRLVVVSDTKTDMANKLRNYLNDGFSEGVITNINNSNIFHKDRKVMFMFTGQGSQYINMGKTLFESNEIFKNSMIECEKIFKPYILKSIIDLLYREDASNEVIQKTVYAQPLIFAIEYSLSKYLESIGVNPEIVVGHSIGEYAAAVSSNIMTLNDAAKLVSIRGRLMDSAPGNGAMGTIFADENTVRKLIDKYNGKVVIAAHNAKDTIVISGEYGLVEEVLKKAEEEKHRIRRLKVSHGFHSNLMSPILEDFNLIASEVEFNNPSVRFVSSVYAKEISANKVLDSMYWTNHIREKVDFYNAIISIDKSKDYVFLEVGPNRVLSALCNLIFEDERIIGASLNVKKEDSIQLAETIALLYVNGVNINWSNVEFKGRKSWRKYSLPNYPFERESYWKDLKYDRESADVICDTGTNKLLGQKIESPNMNNGVIYQRKFTESNPFFMGEHIIFDTPISPAAAHISMVLSAMKDINNPSSCTIKELELRSPLAISNGEERTVQVCFEDTTKNDSSFSLVSRDMNSKGDKWRIHTQGLISSSKVNYRNNKTIDLEKIKDCEFDYNIEGSLYDFMRAYGFELGDGFRRIMKSTLFEGDTITFIEPMKNIPSLDMYELYPGVIDSILQTLFCVCPDELRNVLENSGSDMTIIPYYVGEITYNYKKSRGLWCRTSAKIKDNAIYGDIEVYNENGELLIEINDIMAKITDKRNLLREIKNNYKAYYYNIDWIKKIINYEPYKNDKEKIVIVSKDFKVAKSIQDKLKEKNIDPVIVVCKEKFMKKNKDLYLCGTEKESWMSVIRNIKEDYDNIDIKFIYACGIKSLGYINENTELKGLLNLIKGIYSLDYDKTCKVKIVTKNVQNIENTEEINLSQSLLWGFARVLEIELPGIYSGILDIDDNTLKVMGETFINEVLENNSVEVCLRENERYISKLIKNVDYVKSNNIKSQKITIREEGTYLITGGTGALGMVYAEYLVEKGAKSIALMCRKKPKQEVIDKVNNFNEKGVKTEFIYADICNRGEVQKAIHGIANNMQDIVGVVHAAGTINDRMILDTSWEDCEFVIMPKVQGLLNIYETLDKGKLDFIISLSSITSLLGNMGQANYASANYFLNTFTKKLQKENIAAYTFCWGPWSGSGMATEADAIERNMRDMGINTIDPEVGLKIIDEFFEEAYDNLLIVDIDWSKYGNSIAGESKRNILSNLISIDESNLNREREENLILEDLNDMNNSDRREYLNDKIQNIAGKIMGYTKGQVPSTDISFMEQGVDSLMLFSIRSSINKIMGIDISVSSLFNYPTISKLSDYLIEEVLFNVTDNEEVSESTEDILLELESLL